MKTGAPGRVLSHPFSQGWIRGRTGVGEKPSNPERSRTGMEFKIYHEPGKEESGR